MALHTDINDPHRPGPAVYRVGLFGGTFDPVHLGHVHVADEVKAAFGLSRIIVMPSSVPPHKPVTAVSDSRDRLYMVRLCFEGREGFEVSDMELRRQGPSYTVDTLSAVAGELGRDAGLSMILGSDAFFELHTWRAFDRILEAVPLIVIVRPGIGRDPHHSVIDQASVYLSRTVTDGYVWNDDAFCFTHPKNKAVYLFRGTPYPVSSTEIRQGIRTGRDVSPWLQKDVLDYINNKGLYA
ncbi:nicotinate-nucleotide adenylyltransferase [Desulfatiferula olefinivorans]